MKKLLVTLSCVLAVCSRAAADEGMWMLPFLQKVNYEEMKSKGLKLKADDIYNAAGSSLKDAIVIFGRGCTAEVVSAEGLLLTNHHCGYGNIQSLSSVEHDYLKNGFWAMNRGEEIPAPGLTVTFIRKIEEVTDIILDGITDDTPQDERGAAITKNRMAYVAEMKGKYPGHGIDVKGFFAGNQYFAFVTETYKDVRLVGAPPTSIGKFGGDTDNWMWPRHTGDFAMFRIYSAPDGSPADYSKDNVPYNTPAHLKVSAKGYREGDFAMIMGFPGTTTRYMTTYEIDEMLDVSNPNRIYIRSERLAILKEDMDASDKVRIQYASKYASSSNYWKNSIGKSSSVKKLRVRDKKQALEDDFTSWANDDPARTKYRRALPLIKESKEESVEIQGAVQVLSEAVLSSMEIAALANHAARPLPLLVENNPDRIPALAETLYKNYNEATDRKVTKRMIEILIEMLPTNYRPAFIETEVMAKFGGDAGAYTDWLFENSVFANKEKMLEFAAAYNKEVMDSDPAMYIHNSTFEKFSELREALSGPSGKLAEGRRLYVAGLLEMQPDAMHYPDANSSIRLTYGQVLPYSPADGIEYNYYTTLKGVIEKENPSNPGEFTVPDKLKALYYSEDYGRWADFTGVSKKERKRGAKGHLNTCFLTNNDITGGNSGSPVLNSHGELIGLAFDGNWEAMSGDVVFEPGLQRCINVDIRYVLFIIDKFAGASHLISEMTVVQ